MRNCASSPMLMAPAATSRAPTQSTPTIPENTRIITSTVMTARVPMRRRAEWKADSVSPPKRAREGPSWVKACTVWTASRSSEPLPELSAMRSWFSRPSRRSLRPISRIGAITAGTIRSTSPVSLGEV